MTTTRIAREVQGREYEEWGDLDQYTDTVDQMELPPGVYREGYVYRYVRVSARGIEDYNLPTAAKQGWRAVPADRQTGHMDLSLLGRSGELSGYITRRDTILCERPAPLQTREKAAFQKLNDDRIRPYAEAFRERKNAGIMPTRQIAGF